MKQFGGNLLKYATTPAILIGALWFMAEFISKSEARQFDSPVQKVTTIQRVDALPTPREQAKQYLLDSLNTVSAIRSRALRDSLQRIESTRDSLTATTIYQMKEEIEMINLKIENKHID